MNRHVTALALFASFAAFGLVAGCNRQADKPEEVRPVRAERIAPRLAGERTGYSGEVRARYETRLAFRVPGKIVSREVDVGQAVRRGQVLARIDARDLELYEAGMRAQAGAAKSELELAEAELKRYEELRLKNFISQAEFDRRRSAYTTSRAKLDQVEAQRKQAGNQSSYAALRADAEGIVTALEAEAGQVVAAGQTVARIARLEEKEIVISVPEQRVDDLKRATRVEARLWASPDRSYAAKVREIAPSSDPVTRTYTVKISVPGAGPGMRLGMTASVELGERDAAPRVRLPLAALYEKGDATGRQPALWVVDPQTSTVSLVAVKTGALSGNEVVIDSGLAPGQLVVTAGVHLLRPGQKVRLLEGVK